MDRITFQYDTVLSDVHMLLPNTRHLMTRLNDVGQPVFTSRFQLLSAVGAGVLGKGDVAGKGEENPLLDEDGDIDVTHRPRKSSGTRESVCPIILNQCTPVLEEEAGEDADVIRIEHTMATPLADVGKQVWRGACYLADFILSEAHLFRGATVLELGAGTGLTSVIMATKANRVYCTDVGRDLLRMCKRNVTLNEHLMVRSGAQVRVRHLDWLQDDLCTDDDDEFCWSEEEEADLYDNTNLIIAADICYDDDLTDGLFKTIYRFCCAFSHTCTAFISVERRMNFTLRHMDVSCEAYNHFTRCLNQLQDMEDGGRRFRVEQVPSDFAQFLEYERVEQLELWKITATPVVSPDPPQQSEPEAPAEGLK